MHTPYPGADGSWGAGLDVLSCGGRVSTPRGSLPTWLSLPFPCGVPEQLPETDTVVGADS